MGCVPHRSQAHPESETCIYGIKALAELKDSFVFHIFRLHKLMLCCRQAVQESISLDNREISLVLKEKEIIIKETLKKVRESVKTIDDLIAQQGGLDKYLKKQIMEEGTFLLKEISGGVFVNDISSILDSSSNYWTQVKSELGKYEVDQTYLQQLIDQDIQKNRFKGDKNVKRKRYSKDSQK